MGQAVFIVSQAGPLVTIQDRGRPGLMRFGVPASGPMDRDAFAIAHAALGNRAAGASIEVSRGGLGLECVDGAVTFSVAGGGFQVEIDGAALGAWSTATISAGSRLAIQPGYWGSWTYLAFAGTLQAREWLGSVSTHAPSALGGGRLAVGQRLVVEDAEVREKRVGLIPLPVSARPRHSIKVVLGPQDRFFSADTIETLFSQTFRLTDSYDRMGVRLAGPSLRPSAALDMPSEAIVRGSIQVGGDGTPTVLLADHQTTGGYPKIATVISDDINSFVQLRSRDKVVFQRTTPQAAIEAARTQRRADARFLDRLR